MSSLLITEQSIATLVRDLPPAPQIVPKLHRLVASYNTNPDEIWNLIKLDQSLVAKVIQASNNAYYATASRIENIEEAVLFLGFREVYKIIALAAFSRVFRRPLTVYGLDQQTFWRQSVACALAMQRLFKDNHLEPANGYTIGILHQVGMVFVEMHILSLRQESAPPHRFQVVEGFGNTHDEEELTVLGMTQSEVGALALERWKFAPSIVEPIRFQSSPFLCNDFEREACLLNFSRWIVQKVLSPQEGEAKGGDLDPQIEAILDGDNREIQDLVTNVREDLGRAEDLLSVF